MALNDAKEKIHQFENAIKKLDSIKKHLNRNAFDIKGEIHSCVSHNLEFLRVREVSLLSKVDEVVSQKEEALQQQQARLNQALGVLQTRMSLKDDDSFLDRQMTETLRKLNDIDLSPGETPHIAFRADHISLKESILNYGRVDANALPLLSAFKDQTKPSVSLPLHLEEYDDVDHHVFHKTVEQIKSDQGVKSINVSIPKLSTKMEDWLQKRAAVPEEKYLPPVRPTTLGQSSAKPFNIPVKPSCSTPADINSLSSWLSQIKHHADLEEEHDYEIVDNTNSNQGKMDVSNNLSPDTISWLLNSPGYIESLIADKNQNNNLFQHIPLDSKYWLRQAQDQITSLEESKKTDLFQHISKEPSSWLRSRAYGKQVSQSINEDKEKDRKSLKKKDLSPWLVQCSEPKREKMENINNSCCKQDVWLQKPAQAKQDMVKSPKVTIQLEDICKANELCSNLSECVLNPNCAILCQQELSGVKNPIDPTKVFNPLDLPTSQWLIPAQELNDCQEMDFFDKDTVTTEKLCPKSREGKNLFGHIADISSDVWLAKPSTSTPFSPMPVFKQSKEETNNWLRQGFDSPSCADDEEMTPTKAFEFKAPYKSIEDWLFTPSKEEEEFMKDDSEGWSLCSSPTSFNSEQFTKDVKIATTYLQNWVL